MNKIVGIDKVLTGITQCVKMSLRGEDRCCARCPYNRRSNCFVKLLNDCEFIITELRELSAENFAHYLANHKDGTLMGYDGSEEVGDIIDIDNLPFHLDNFYKEYINGMDVSGK